MNVTILCKAIGKAFGSYKEKDGKYIIRSGGQVYCYNTPERLIADWVSQLVEQHITGIEDWSAEVEYIYTHVLHTKPNGVSLRCNWEAESSIVVHEDNYRMHCKLGAYKSLIDAIAAKRHFEEWLNNTQLRRKQEVFDKIHDMQLKAH